MSDSLKKLKIEFPTLAVWAYLSDNGRHEADDNDDAVVGQLLQDGQLAAQPVRQVRHLTGNAGLTQ